QVGAIGGVCVVLFCIVIWLIKLLVSRIDKSNSVIAKHTDVSHSILKSQETQNKVNSALRDELLKRPCMATHK
ncbi:MAG: hypothetical protein JRE23_18235, partial [Deltaproteobacteria bacterium]|nr:hypothetical protein [Deltaproteobacteria bacterium]